MALLIRAYGARVLVNDDVPLVVRRRLRATLPSAMASEEVPGGDTEADAHYTVSADDREGTYSVLRNGLFVERGRNLRSLSRSLHEHVTLEIARHARTALLVRAGVVAWRGYAILIPETGTSDTSTLIGELVRRGATHFSDEFAVIDEVGLVHPYLGSAAPAHASAPAETEPASAALLLATTCAPKAAWAPVALEGARALLPLLEHAPAMQIAPRRTLEFAARLAPRLISLRGERPEASTVAPALLELVDRLRDGVRAQAALADAPRSAATPIRLPDVIEDPSWVPVAVSRPGKWVRFRRFTRPFHIAHAGTNPRPWDVELPLGDVEAAASTLRDPAKVLYVYHHGYAGSTLLFRLLDAPGVCLAYDEPNVHFHFYANPSIRALCYRTFRATETPMIKAVAAEIVHARQHFADHSKARALFLYAPLEEYVAASLAHDYRHRYVTKLARFLGGSQCSDPGDAAAYCWERITAEVIAMAEHHRLRTIEANAFFSDPEHHLAAIWACFGFPRRDDWSATLERVGSTHAKNRRPFTREDRLAQKRAYAAHARPWLDRHAARLAAAQETLERLHCFSLSAAADPPVPTSRPRETRTKP